MRMTLKSNLLIDNIEEPPPMYDVTGPPRQVHRRNSMRTAQTCPTKAQRIKKKMYLQKKTTQKKQLYEQVLASNLEK